MIPRNELLMTQVGPPDWATTTFRAGMARFPKAGRRRMARVGRGRESAPGGLHGPTTTRPGVPFPNGPDNCDRPSRSFPRRSFRQKRLELGEPLPHVIPGIGSGEEPGKGFLVKPLPRLVLVARVDRV